MLSLRKAKVFKKEQRANYNSKCQSKDEKESFEFLLEDIIIKFENLHLSQNYLNIDENKGNIKENAKENVEERFILVKEQCNTLIFSQKFEEIKNENFLELKIQKIQKKIETSKISIFSQNGELKYFCQNQNEYENIESSNFSIFRNILISQI